MPITDDRTPSLNLPLPYADNMLDDDSERLREALLGIDSAVAGKASAGSVDAVNTALSAKADLVAGKVPASQLPAYVDDVVEGANLAALPAEGESGKIYVALDTGKAYRWGGSAYAEISPSPGSTDAVPEGASNLYFTPARAEAGVPIASATVAGKVKVGNGLGIDGSGVLFSALGGGSAMSISEVVPVTNGLTQVGVPDGYVVGSILVAVNGAFLAPSDYTATDGVVVSFTGFTVGTADSVVIVKLSTVVISSLPPGSVGTTQLADGSATGDKLGSDVVATTGDQTITGAKTFDQPIVGSVTGNAGSVTNGVYTVGDQTIGGTKTFTNLIYGNTRGIATCSVDSLIGYVAGAGDAVEQSTSKSTAVTINKPTGFIITHSQALAAGASVVFTVNNSKVSGVDFSIVVAHPKSSTKYIVSVLNATSGAFTLRLTNITGGTLSEQVGIGFSVFSATSYS